ncbi:hypothetical protein PC113_g9955 [Phytophthora cactorum]|uniref:Uncharacterized protein n=1 Tax=Phytophthora cactorum TaxID=29920 RepID=A0A8T0Z8I2_9STRA|nr:hypothetical protein PC113_g9955 [Phytophthora cactorum]KAG2892444.1 hypothetical protein PC115_g18814 [Phytophthora cactorum]KAG2893516.1 hypothetical protein PC114_g16219 [Phytophthora cactorum]KAG3060862.1 hypothetical protein PC122_g19861 [Phytophthora cactorum]KAG3176947.1 hypothetical protein C6341_g8713 [Phytophthora cactorum]
MLILTRCRTHRWHLSIILSCGSTEPSLRQRVDTRTGGTTTGEACERQALPVRPPPSYRLPCLSRPTTQRLQSRPIPGRLAAATTEKTCILGEKFLMSPQSELTISNS